MLKIYDRSGKFVFEQTTTLSQIELNVAGFGAGTYVIKVFLDNEIITSQFVKS
ncbi:MAG: T9SS type A sorting domain-containing protein [Crocinitomicaceae bacterium]|nr:T9SS type A sorting domain-containing protein [Crocinitomicaceae bacterium]